MKTTRTFEEGRMSENVRMTIPIVTVSDVTLPRWMTPFAKHLFAIPTHMTVQERLVLFQTAIALPQGFSVLEIGSYLGASTAFLGFAALHRAGFVHAVGDVHARESRIPCNMLFIDGDHSYEAVVTDLRLWLPSLQPGGILAMHDIDSPDVKRAFETVVGADRLSAPPQVTDRLLICQPNDRPPG
jgi:predicted O-methyltransferase YrrM